MYRGCDAESMVSRLMYRDEVVGRIEIVLCSSNVIRVRVEGEKGFVDGQRQRVGGHWFDWWSTGANHVITKTGQGGTGTEKKDWGSIFFMGPTIELPTYVTLPDTSYVNLVKSEYISCPASVWQSFRNKFNFWSPFPSFFGPGYKPIDTFLYLLMWSYNQTVAAL